MGFSVPRGHNPFEDSPEDQPLTSAQAKSILGSVDPDANAIIDRITANGVGDAIPVLAGLDDNEIDWLVWMHMDRMQWRAPVVKEGLRNVRRVMRHLMLTE